ncbi:ExbD/TolR family protein [Burkholderia anthina]|uniref:ExbD/TolR family protein n=1 Tax=Burkholderia anthina TaxID=179879 RepID=UPI00158F0624|nr:biopolymer transporter ExbD [Burkholderia anthina]
MRTLTSRAALRDARRRTSGELNVVSLIDVMVVLVFFLLLQTLDITSFDVDLPGYGAAPLPNAEQPLTIVVDATAVRATLGAQHAHTFAKRGNTYDLAGLDAWLTVIKRDEPSRTNATVLSAPGIAYGDLVPVLDAVRGVRQDGTTALFTDIALGDAPGRQETR